MNDTDEEYDFVRARLRALAVAFPAALRPWPSEAALCEAPWPPTLPRFPAASPQRGGPCAALRVCGIPHPGGRAPHALAAQVLYALPAVSLAPAATRAVDTAATKNAGAAG